MRIFLAVFLMLGSATSQDIRPDAPAPTKLFSSSRDTLNGNHETSTPVSGSRSHKKSEPPAPGFWDVGNPDSSQPLRTNSQIFHDHLWQTTQAVWLSSIVYDEEVTHQGLAHHKCYEKNLFNNPNPSRWQLYRNSIPEYAFGTAFNYLMMRYVTKSLILGFPAIATKEHIEGGTQWFTEGCW